MQRKLAGHTPTGATAGGAGPGAGQRQAKALADLALWMERALGDALHALCCAAGYNIRWLLRAIARRGLAVAFFTPVYLLVRLLALITARYAALQSWSASYLSTTRTDHYEDGQLGLVGSK